MTGDKEHSIPPERIEELFDLLRSRNDLAFGLLRTLFRKHVFRYAARYGIRKSYRDELYRQVSLNIWISTSDFPCAARLSSHIGRIIKNTTRDFIAKRLNERDRVTLLDRLDIAFRRIHGHADPDTRHDALVQAQSIVDELRRL